MAEVGVDQLKAAVESQYGGTANFVRSTPVTVRDNGKIVWDGTVTTFELVGHPRAIRAYAWSWATDAIIAVLHAPQISSPSKAVTAAILTERQNRSA